MGVTRREEGGEKLVKTFNATTLVIRVVATLVRVDGQNLLGQGRIGNLLQRPGQRERLIPIA
jgi:hypothetical protein